MRTIQEGKPEIQIQCPDCKTVLGVEPDDIKSHSWTDYGGESETVYTAQCNTCPTKINIKNALIPNGWRAHIQGKK